MQTFLLMVGKICHCLRIVLDSSEDILDVHFFQKPNLILNVDGCIAVCLVDLLRNCGSFTRFVALYIHRTLHKLRMIYKDRERCMILAPYITTTNIALEMFEFVWSRVNLYSDISISVNFNC